ncbi:putative mitochondrial ATP-dependent helicase irc3 [Diplodia seriata]|uniref:Putative mitochondrial ATP-dependent helicase irc3 n=1 Tax=Diplodia seriata TaxID=420778 RepID=A0A1S8B4U4_9PEZI|nr:putative mitochondrial ATP-dependent helicase irc3 [Diplodia seriata]
MLRISRHALRGIVYGPRSWNRPIGIRYARTKARAVPADPPPPITRPGIQLRDYQEECIQSVLAYLEKGHKRLGVSLATGSGKTVIFTQLIDRVLPPNSDATQTLILAHRRELVEQAARHCTNAYPDKTVDVEMGAVHASGAADITVASVQSIMSGDRIDKFDPKRFKLVLVDEAHHIVSRQYLEALEWFGLRRNTNSATALVGVSATFSRFDGKKLGTVIDHVVYHRDYVQMIEDKWLSDVIFTTVSSKADISKVELGANGDFHTGALSQAINTDETNEITVRSWLAKASDRKSTLVFCVDLAHLTDLTATFRRHGIDAKYVTGDTPNKIRAERIDQFKWKEYPVLLNCGVFTEGTDIPNIDCVILARPTRSRNLLIQMIGRGMRLHSEKENCHIIDMVATLETGIITTPTLLGLDPDAVLEQTSADDAKKIKERKEKEKIRDQELAQVRPDASSGPVQVRSKVTITEYSSIHELLDDTSPDQNIRRISHYTWVCVGEERFMLACNQNGHIVVERNEEGAFTVKYTKAIPVWLRSKGAPPFQKPQLIAKAETLEHAIHSADTFAAETFPLVFIDKWAPWRKNPASEAQVEFLNKRRDQDHQLTPEDITKGRAMDMITRIRHGAKGRYEKIRVQNAKKERERERERRQLEKLNPTVKVGPLAQDV